MRAVSVACLLLLAGACAPTHAGRTVGRGVLQVEGALGGPFIENLGPPIPVPNLPIGARYGVTDRIDVAAHVNVLPMIMGGFMTLDAGATFGILRHEGRRGPNLASQVGFALLTDFQEGARVTPMVDLAGGYTIDWFTPFAGVELMVDAWGKRILGNFFVGFEADIGDWTLASSAVWFTPWYDTFSSAVEYAGTGGNGGLGFLLGVKYRFHLLGRDGKGGDS